MKKIIFTLGVVCAASSSLMAQQNSYSLYSVSPVFTNPAGITMPQQRHLALSYRSISIGSNDRISLSSLRFFNPLKLSKKNTGAIDANVFTERTGPNGIFQQTGILIGAAYDLRISSAHRFTFGLQPGILFRGLNENKIRTDSQYANGSYDPNAPTGENSNGWKTTSFTLNTGLNWKFFGNKKISYNSSNTKETSPIAWAGIAFYNLNRANTTFYTEEKRMPVRTIISGGYIFQRKQYELIPTARIIHEASSYLINAGAFLSYSMKSASDIQKVGAGILLSNARSAIFSLQMTHTKIFTSIGYEIPFQKGIDGNSMTGALEIHLSCKL